VEKLGAGIGAEGVEALTEFALDLGQGHVDRTLAPGGDEDGWGNGGRRRGSSTSVE
jgi:hypothetical protein